MNKSGNWRRTLVSNGVSQDVVDGFTGDQKEDYTAIMDFLCNRWQPSGAPEDREPGCQPKILQNNLDAYQVWESLAGSKYPADIKAAIELNGVENIEDCYQRVLVLMKG